MSSPADAFEPDAVIVDAVVAGIVPTVRKIERQLKRPLSVLGSVMVGDAEGSLRWGVEALRKEGEPLVGLGRAIFRRTGGGHVLYRVEFRVPTDPSTGWTGMNFSGSVRPGSTPVLENRAMVTRYNSPAFDGWT
jgi:hypothetical protein